MGKVRLTFRQGFVVATISVACLIGGALHPAHALAPQAVEGIMTTGEWTARSEPPGQQDRYELTIQSVSLRGVLPLPSPFLGTARLGPLTARVECFTNAGPSCTSFWGNVDDVAPLTGTDIRGNPLVGGCGLPDEYAFRAAIAGTRDDMHLMTSYSVNDLICRATFLGKTGDFIISTSTLAPGFASPTILPAVSTMGYYCEVACPV